MKASPGSPHVWASSPLERLRGARSASRAELQQITEMLFEGCPATAWPFGCSTSINPWIVFLGPSPGNSPAQGDNNREGTPPTAGTPPYAMEYRDPRKFFDRLRSLTIALISADAGTSVLERDALALAGMMNLDSGLSGQAQSVNVDVDFARWVLDVSIRRLRPRYIVGVGLGGFLLQPKHRWLLDLFGTYVGQPFVPNRPPISTPFQAYSKQQYVFRAWPLPNASATPQHFIMFPQHPSRAPMTSPAIWAAAVQEFVAFATGL